jgi:hypothetical protein
LYPGDVQPNTVELLAKKGGETKLNIAKYLTLVALATAALGISACAKKEAPPPPPPPAPTTGYTK